MAKFLNRDSIISEFKKIISTARKEIVIITPFLNVSDEFLKQLQDLQNRKVEVLLIYRENTLADVLRDKLFKFSNLTVLSHSTLHAKCYFNESRMIISSLNLLEYSAKNNREMGILVVRDEASSATESDSWSFDDPIYEDCIKETKEIAKAADFEKRSVNVEHGGFNFSVLKEYKAALEDVLRIINPYFENKHFKISTTEYYDHCIECDNYKENVKVLLELDIDQTEFGVERAMIKLKHPPNQLSKLLSKFKNDFHYSKTNGNFKYYWNKIEQPIYVYPRNRFYFEKLNSKDSLREFRTEVDSILSYFKKHKEFTVIF